VSEDAIVVNKDVAAEFISLLFSNSILSAPTAAKRCIVSNYTNLDVAHADANCYNHGGNQANVGGVAVSDLAAWQSRYGQDAHSQEADPLFGDYDLRLAAGSPCFMTGRAAVAAGLEGNERAITIDQGPYQSSPAISASLNYSGGQATIQIAGALRAQGL
jgi:hypothetical protein